jgi:hypothetical protein
MMTQCETMLFSRRALCTDFRSFGRICVSESQRGREIGPTRRLLSGGRSSDSDSRFCRRDSIPSFTRRLLTDTLVRPNF